MNITFTNYTGDKNITIHYVSSIEYLEGHELRLKFYEYYYDQVKEQLNPKCWSFDDKNKTIDIESDVLNYHIGDKWNGFLINYYLYTEFKIEEGEG